MKFTNYLKDQTKKIQGRTKIRIPQFRMVFSSPKIRNDSNQTISTKAYAIEVKFKDSIPMLQTLKSLLSTTPSVFVPFSMRNKFPEGFTKAIKYQTQQLTSNMVIVLQYLHPDMMFHIDEFIKSINGVIDIMPDKSVLTTGKYRVQVTQSTYKTARESLIHYLPGWCEEYIPIDAYPHPNPFPASPRVQPNHNDGFSSGENSWMSMSNTSFLSMDLSHVADDDYFSNTTVATRAFTYAEIVLPPIPTKPAAHRNDNSLCPSDDDTKAAISEITTTAKTDSLQAQQQELENAKQTIENQRMEIQKLKEEQAKADAKYTNILATMNTRLQEQDSEAATMKQDIAIMIAEQQNQHTIEMQDLYTRMMEQMTNLLGLSQQQLQSQPAEAPYTQDSSDPNTSFTYSKNSSNHQDKKQDTRPSPTKRKQLGPKEVGQSPASPQLEQNFPMDVECNSPIIEDDV
jgi:hypothetical protein